MSPMASPTPRSARRSAWTRRAKACARWDSRARSEERRVGKECRRVLFQSFPHMTVLENVSYGLADAALSKAQRLDKAREGLRLVGLEGYDERLPSELSGGQQQRVACARALVLEPQVLLFDEPLSNLDAKLRRRMREEIRDLQQRLPLTSRSVTHDQEEALAVSDKSVVMNKGRIAKEGTPADLYERPADSFVADFIRSATLHPLEML